MLIANPFCILSLRELFQTIFQGVENRHVLKKLKFRIDKFYEVKF